MLASLIAPANARLGFVAILRHYLMSSHKDVCYRTDPIANRYTRASACSIAILLERDWQVQVFNPLLSSKSARTHLRGRKTDADDALFIARTVRDGDFIPFQPGKEDTEQLKLLCRQRRFVSHELANAKRRLTGLIDLGFPEFGRHFDNNHSKAAHAVLKAAPSAAAIARFSLRRLQGVLIGASRGRLGAEKAKALRESAKQSLSANRNDPALDLLIRTMIAQLEFFEKQLAELDLHIQRLFSCMEHPIKTIPGIGSITGPLIAAELGDLRRFEGRRPIHAILAYAGMDPRVRKSGQWSGKIKMSKRGSVALRTALYQAASMARLHEPRLAEVYNHHKQQRNNTTVWLSVMSHANSSASSMPSVPAANHTTPQKYALSQLDFL